ncbi:MAG: hypothetical protein ACO3C1_01445, partial [Ilumatobacteraceae bacterium]
MTAGIAAPLSVPHLAPAPTFQPVPGGAPQPSAVPVVTPTPPTGPLQVVPTPVASVPTVPLPVVAPAELPTEPLPVALETMSVERVPVGSLPVETVPTEVLPTTSPTGAAPIDATPASLLRPGAVADVAPIGIDSQGNPVPPPPLTVGDPIVSTVTDQVAVVEQTSTTGWDGEPTAEQRAVQARSGATPQMPVVAAHEFRLPVRLPSTISAAAAGFPFRTLAADEGVVFPDHFDHDWRPGRR